jgi:TIR domain
MARKKDFFVSYNKSDRFWAAGIREWLQSSGRTVIMEEPDFQAGSNFVIEMHEGLRSAKRMIGVLSPEYLDSRFCSSEWAAKFAQDPIGNERLLIFVKVRECKLDGLLSQIVNIDLTGLTVEAAEAKFFKEIDNMTGSRRNPKPMQSGSQASRRSETSMPASGVVINQQSKGTHSQNIGIQNNLNPRFSIRHEIKPGPEHITPGQRTAINVKLKELGEREAMVAMNKNLPGGPQTREQEQEAKDIISRCFRNLRADFNRQVNDGQPYHLLPSEKYEEALTWIARRKAMKRPSLRRVANELWRRDYERIIWGGMRKKKWQKQDVYDYALERQIVHKPITSLKELGEQKLQALANAMRTKVTKSNKI